MIDLVTKRKRETKSPIPYYAASGILLFYGLLFPVYRWSDLLIMFGLAAAAFLVLRKTVKYEPKEFVYLVYPKTTGNYTVDLMLYDTRVCLEAIVQDRIKINDDHFTKEINRIEDLTDAILRKVEIKPAWGEDLHNWSVYYLPNLLKVTQAYTGRFKDNERPDAVLALDRLRLLAAEIAGRFEKQLANMQDKNANRVALPVELIDPSLLEPVEALVSGPNPNTAKKK